MTRLVPLVLLVACATAHPSIPSPPAVPSPAVPPVVTIAAPLALHNANGHFADANGQRWHWKGATDFLLLKKLLDGEDVTPLLEQRQAAGANLVRVFGMCHNLADFNPATYADAYWVGVEALLTRAAARTMYVELTVFADAQLVMPDPAQQQAFWRHFSQFAGRANLLLELVNENSHVGNTIAVQAFPFLDGILCSHGSEQTDMHPIEPFWHYVTYHARRDGPPDSRGASNYAPYVFEAPYPKDRPWIADEGIKSPDAAFMRLAGEFAGTGDGGTCHQPHGVISERWTDAEFAACQAFFQGVSR